MEKIIIKKPYSCFVFGEGRKDKNFLMVLIGLDKFKYYTKKWTFNYGNAAGGSAKTILKRCCKEVMGCDYHLVLCFIDLDRFKDEFGWEWKKEKLKLEKQTGLITDWLKENSTPPDKKGVFAG